MVKALTIMQPYAGLICLPETDGRAKRVENRTWPTTHRGPLAIHAGMSRKWLESADGDYGLAPEQMVFGAIVAVARLVDCVKLITPHVPRSRFGGVSITSAALMPRRPHLPDEALSKYRWLANHPHVEGPFCWILTDVRPLAKPIPYRGAQQLFEIPDSVFDEVANG